MVNTDYEVKILMTLTLNCPVAESLPREVEDKVKSIASVKMLKSKSLWSALVKIWWAKKQN
jgi:metal-sulfur cluster biosynthetic enzyme